MEDKDLFILHSKCHCCWWPGDTRSQGISSHGIWPSHSRVFQFQHYKGWCFIEACNDDVIPKCFVRYYSIIRIFFLMMGYDALILQHIPSRAFFTNIFNSLGPSDAIWRWRPWSTLVQVMACCLTAPSHYLNQCWLIISKVLWHSSKDIIIRRFEDTNQ